MLIARLSGRVAGGFHGSEGSLLGCRGGLRWSGGMQECWMRFQAVTIAVAQGHVAAISQS
jgi:hypothetical protein